VVKVYPSLWSHNFAREERNGDQHDAYSAAAWMRRAESLATPERAVSQAELDPRSSESSRCRPSKTDAVLNVRKSAARSMPAFWSGRHKFKKVGLRLPRMWQKSHRAHQIDGGHALVD
jgi:hypothetical protein